MCSLRACNLQQNLKFGFGPCRLSSSRQFALWRAGADLSQDKEVCFFYKVSVV
jgi:hypothetical protein